MVPALLRGRVFRRYWSASMISMFGDQVSGVALPLAAVLALHAGAAQMGYLTALEWLPSLLFGLHAGAWVDRRGHRRRTMIAADARPGRAVRHHPGVLRAARADAGAAARVTFAAGVLSVLFNVSDSTLFVSIVAPERYMDGAVADLRQPGAVLRRRAEHRRGAGTAAVRPVRGGRGRAVVPGFGVLPGPDPAGGAAGRRFRGSALAGARFVAGSALVRASLIAVAAINFFNVMFAALYLLYAVRVLHIRPGLVGVLIGAGAIGARARRAGHQAPGGADRGRAGVRGRVPAASPRRWCCGRWRTAPCRWSWPCCSRPSSCPGSG